MHARNEEACEPAALSRHPIDTLSLGVLHLGTKTAYFEQAGYRTVGSVRNLDIDRMIRIPLIGKTTAMELVRKRDALIAACDEASGIDWTAYCSAVGIPLLPDDYSVPTGKGFLRSIPAFLDALADRQPDAVSRAVLRDRICRTPDAQKTLEDIARLVAPPLTRERVRQKEAKLLRELTGGLLNDEYDTLGIHFHPDFSRWWRKAADALAELDEIEVATFVDILCKTWEVPQAEVMEHLPAIVAIVTGEPQMSGGFRAAAQINARLFGTLSDSLESLSVHRLRLGKYADPLAEAGFSTVASLVGGLRSGTISRAGATVGRRAAAHLEVIAPCITSEGAIDWPAYRDALDLRILPASPRESPADFLKNLRDDVEQLLHRHAVTKRSEEIFRLRTGRDAAERMTLQQVADELGTHLPTIKREETVLLKWLDDVVVSRDFSRLEVWLDGNWLYRWNEARAIFEAAENGYEQFAENLSRHWRVPSQIVNLGAPAIWAVLTGYPDGRRSGWKPVAAVPIDSPSLGVIRLKGFRRLH